MDLPPLNIRPQIQLEPKSRPRLRMQMPVRIGNLRIISIIQQTNKNINNKLTTSGSSFASSCSNFHSFVRGISITPSTITCETCTPCGPNSRASDCANARNANLPEAKAESAAEPFKLAVAPVKIRVGGCCGDASLALSSRGRVPWAKLNPPLLFC